MIRTRPIFTGQGNASASACEGVLKPRVVEGDLELGRDRVQGGLVEPTQVDVLGQVLAEQAVGVLVGGPLPGLRGSQK
jgi:hypothetical protein